jgi:hypothetical protein
MRGFAVTVLASLALVIAVNGVATLDRARQDARLREAAATLRPGLAMVFGGLMDERRLQKARLEVIEGPRLTVFGSSRVRKMSGPLVHAPPGDFYNLGMSAAIVEDYIGLWSLIEKRGIRPDVAVFGTPKTSTRPVQDTSRPVASFRRIRFVEDYPPAAGPPRASRAPPSARRRACNRSS